jgi:hypothetical protein
MTPIVGEDIYQLHTETCADKKPLLEKIIAPLPFIVLNPALIRLDSHLSQCGKRNPRGNQQFQELGTPQPHGQLQRSGYIVTPVRDILGAGMNASLLTCRPPGAGRARTWWRRAAGRTNWRRGQ